MKFCIDIFKVIVNNIGYFLVKKEQYFSSKIKQKNYKSEFINFEIKIESYE